MSKDQWIADYERVFDDFDRDAEKHGEEYAEQQARATLKSLGFDPPEIDDNISAIKGDR